MLRHPPLLHYESIIPKCQYLGAIVSPGNPRIRGKMKDVTRFKRIFDEE